jgi:hypothetical protein
MNTLLNKIKKIAMIDRQKTYTAEMETAKGTKYEVQVRANNISEARAMILIDTYHGDKIKRIGLSGV